MTAEDSTSLMKERDILCRNRRFLVDNLEPDDVIDDLIQSRLIGENAAQRVQLGGVSRVEKNRIIVEQLNTSRPGTLKEFCRILRRYGRQSFIADQLEKGKPIQYSHLVLAARDITTLASQALAM